MSPRRRSWLGYAWAAPATALGLVASLAAWPRGRLSVVNGVLEAHGPLLAWALRKLIPMGGGACAITLGHVVLGRDQVSLDDTRAHERVHVGQYERWGPFFLPAYLAASGWQLARGGHPYFDNPFEREAFGSDGPSAARHPRSGRAPTESPSGR